MKLKKIVNEELAAAGKFGRDKKLYVEIFVNPTSKEIEAAASSSVDRRPGQYSSGKHIRFIAFPKDEKVFVFSPKVIHNDIYPVIKRSEKEGAFEGIASKISGVWKAVESSSLRDLKYNFEWGYTGTTTKINNFYKTDWRFVNKYISVNEIIKKYLEIFRKQNVRGLKGIK